MNPDVESRFVDLNGLRLHFREASPFGSERAEGRDHSPRASDCVLLLHGWPTSSFLWREVMPPIARHRRVIALDLPGFGQSDKPLDASYSFRFFSKVLTDFLDSQSVDRVALVVHDLGGPIGIYWACHHRERVRELALLNTLVYPQFSWAVTAFVLATRTPLLGSLLASPTGLRWTMKLGVHDRSRLAPGVIEQVQAPFRTKAARKVLLKAGHGLHPAGFKKIERLLPEFEIPVRAIYGARDRVLPDIAKTVARIAHDLPQTEVTKLPDCGHFLQEERGAEIGEMLAEFFKASHPNR